MTPSLLIRNGTIVNENAMFKGNILVLNGKIAEITAQEINVNDNCEIIDAENKFVFPGIIDTHVHFREPGATHKGSIYSESRAAVAGGVTSFMDMPNTNPPAITLKSIEEKAQIAKQHALANYSFYLGVSTKNINEIRNAEPPFYGAIKLFLGASTGNMEVTDVNYLHEVFKAAKIPVALHCEENSVIAQNLENYTNKYGEHIPFRYHAQIRSREACIQSTQKAIYLSLKHQKAIHLLHISTAEEIELIKQAKKQTNLITAETCPHYLLFNDEDYDTLQNKIKCNPAIKSKSDSRALLKALNEGIIDSIATDHAPHTLDEKQNSYIKSPSGIPTIQHSLLNMLELYVDRHISIEKIVQCMCHNPADIFKIKERGYLRKGYKADIAIVEPTASWKLQNKDIFHFCKWTPYEGKVFHNKIYATIVNGKVVYKEDLFNELIRGEQISFEGLRAR